MTKNKRTESSVRAVYKFNRSSTISRPLLGSRVPAGFPSPAQDYVEAMLDMNEYLVPHPLSTFFVKVEGYSMINAGIHPEDLLVVDRCLEPSDNKIVIAIVDGELTVKRLRIINGIYWLVPENNSYDSIKIDENVDLIIWGVVTYMIHKA